MEKVANTVYNALSGDDPRSTRFNSKQKHY